VYAIWDSPNPDARDALYDAAFAAGPAIIPQLEAALKDDRTAEFAAQALAFIGGSKALEILSRLVDDRRDLDLQRFYYGALGEFQTPQATQVLLDAINRADLEPDRTVTEAAILALTVRSDPNLVTALQQAQPKVKDVVLRDDLDNALEVIQARTRYLASPEGRAAGGSVEQAVRTYFIPALEPPPSPEPSKPFERYPAPKPPAGAGAPGPAQTGANRRPGAAPANSQVKVEIQSLTFSSDKSRALARVVFEDPSALAYYDMVLQKRYGNWNLASVWLGSEMEKPGANEQAAPSPEK
jgi:hypothetical protein